MTKIPSVDELSTELAVTFCREFCKDTPRIKRESGVVFAQRLRSLAKLHFTQALTADRTALLTELREWADSRIKPQKHGKDCLGEYCDRAFCNWDDIFHKNKEMELRKARINNLINPSNL